MPMDVSVSESLSADDWLSTIEREYLGEFVRDGGAAVKFVVADTGTGRQALSARLQGAAQDNGYLFVGLDAAHIRVHMIDKVFHEVARHVAWDDLARDYSDRLLAALGYPAPLDPRDRLSRPRVERELQGQLLHHYGMSQEFRIAMLWLCMAQLYPEEPNLSRATAVQEWLRGELRLISAVTRAGLFQKIGRHDARHMLMSLSAWLHACGRTGLVLALDIARCLETPPRRGERDDSVYYSGGAFMDGYEVLRQFVDGTDEMERCLIVVMAPPTLLTDERRSLSSYQALKLRVLAEVHDRRRANPRAPLVRVH